jgi:hypothetical protein
MSRHPGDEPRDSAIVTTPAGEERDHGHSPADLDAMADREAARYEDAFWGPGL